MANLAETPQWENGIYQIETTDPVVGGPDGISNVQAKQLANRTGYLNETKAPLDSPAFSGTPTAPTAPAWTNNNQIATTAFVQDATAPDRLLVGIKTVDGSGSGLDADLLDGKDSSAFLEKIGGTLTGKLSIINSTDGNPALELGRIDGFASTPYIDFNSGSTATDYDARIVASGGNGQIGGGILEFQSAELKWNGIDIATTASATDAIKGLVELATDAEVAAGTDTTRAVTPAGLIAAFQQMKSGEGYIRLPGGLIIQWGQVQCSSSSAVNWVYPIAYTTFVRVAATALATAPQIANIDVPTLTYVPVSAYEGSIRSPNTVMILAIGY